MTTSTMMSPQVRLAFNLCLNTMICFGLAMAVYAWLLLPVYPTMTLWSVAGLYLGFELLYVYADRWISATSTQDPGH